jgi:hypothetical protein
MEKKNYFGERLHLPEYLHNNSAYKQKISQLYSFIPISPIHWARLKCGLTHQESKNS